MPDDRMAYLAVAPCGCPHGADSGEGKDTAKTVADWIKRGSTVERVTVEEARERMVWECPHTPEWGRA